MMPTGYSNSILFSAGMCNECWECFYDSKIVLILIINIYYFSLHLITYLSMLSVFVQCVLACGEFGEDALLWKGGGEQHQSVLQLRGAQHLLFPLLFLLIFRRLLSVPGRLSQVIACLPQAPGEICEWTRASHAPLDHAPLGA